MKKFNTKIWIMTEAQKIVKAYKDKKEIVLQMGYGASGIPTLGTFAEAARTLMIKKAVDHVIKEENLDIKTKCIIFSDDMDGLRKVPGNIPNKEVLERNLGKPLTSIPDPFGKYDSFGNYNNNKLLEFLSFYGINVQLTRATELYKKGRFDNELLIILKEHKKILDIMLPTLGEERRATYSPFLPISPKTGRFLEKGVVEYKQNTIVCRDEDGTLFETEVTGGKCKLQWKVDWPMRWNALGICYELYGKDLVDTYNLSKHISRVIGKEAPLAFMYEHFLDELGGRISKSKGNGFTVEQWLRYAPKETLMYFLCKNPSRARILSFDTLPNVVDDYLDLLKEDFDIKNPAWYFCDKPQKHPGITYNLLLNLANACNASSKEIMIHYISKYYPDYDNNELLKSLLSSVVNYYHDFVLPSKKYHTPSEDEKKHLALLKEELLSKFPGSENEGFEKVNGQEIQHVIYDVGKKTFGKENLKDWFAFIYKALMGQEKGPRLGSFIEVYGVHEFIKLIDEKIS